MIPVADRIAVDRKDAAALFGLTGDTWSLMHRDGLCPMPRMVRFSKRWDLADLKAWSAAGCPTRAAWQRSKRRTPE